VRALRVAVREVGLAAARGRDRGGVPRRSRRGARPREEAGGDRGAAQQAALAVPLGRDVLDRGDCRPARHPAAPLRVGRTGGAAPPARPIIARDAALAAGRYLKTMQDGLPVFTIWPVGMSLSL